jgi:hypothetical protein
MKAGSKKIRKKGRGREKEAGYRAIPSPLPFPL